MQLNVPVNHAADAGNLVYKLTTSRCHAALTFVTALINHSASAGCPWRTWLKCKEGASVPMSEGYIPFHPNPSKPKYKPPARRGRCPLSRVRPGSGFSLCAGTQIHPATRRRNCLFARRDFLGFDKNVIVQASCHSKDNRAMVDALDASNGRARGVAFRGSGSDRQGTQMDARRRAYVACGSISSSGWLIPHHVRYSRRSSRRSQPLGWHVVIYFEMPDLAENEEFFTSLPTTVVFDHMGTPDVSQGRRSSGKPAIPPHAGKAREHVGKGRLVPNAMSIAGPPYDDVVPLPESTGRKVFRIACIWGTDWPHPEHEEGSRQTTAFW